MYFHWTCCVLVVASATGIGGQFREAIAHLASDDVQGTVFFTETEDGVHVTGSITGLAAGYHGFHIHELGDTSTCVAAGAHFNPDGNNHGGRDQEERHVGDLGNVEFIGDGLGVATVDFIDTVISLRGRNNIIGRTLVIHEDEDDLGLGGYETSLTTGNAGDRVACGVIGVLSPANSWDD